VEGALGRGEVCDEPEAPGSNLLGIGALLVVGAERAFLVRRPDSEASDRDLGEPVGFVVVEAELDADEVFPPLFVGGAAAEFGVGWQQEVVRVRVLSGGVCSDPAEVSPTNPGSGRAAPTAERSGVRTCPGPLIRLRGTVLVAIRAPYFGGGPGASVVAD